VAEAASAVLGSEVVEFTGCPGGDINQGWRLTLADGSVAFFKGRPGAERAEFEMEAAGLAWLGAADALPVPEVLGTVGGSLPGLLLEWIEPGGRLDGGGEEAFGRGLAAIHRLGADSFGQLPDGAPNRELHVGPVGLGECFHEDQGRGFGPCYAQRLEGLMAQAFDRGAIEPGERDAIASVCARMESLAGPPEPPARTHGDLWSGNVLVGADGSPWLIDPAAHGAQRELDLAMLWLFGAPSDRFLAAYKEVFPLEPDYRHRIDLWQIQPLLIHAILFGGPYGAAAARAASAYL
jgi:fructosamine-3-kinase